MDARRRRSQEALRHTVLTLASTTSLGALTVPEIAAGAGVNRSTFYQHAASVPQLLRDALRAELDEARTEHLARLSSAPSPAEWATALDGVTIAVLRHVDARAAVYGRAFAPQPSGSDAGDTAGLAVMLTDHFERSAADLLTADSFEMPVGPSPDLRPVAARFIAAGTVGAIQAWIRTPAPRDPVTFAATVAALQPQWWRRSTAAPFVHSENC